MIDAAGVAPVERIRADFPALERTHAGTPVAYFDGPGGTQVPRAVVDAVADYLLHHNANTHWAYPSSAETDAAIAAARAAVADFLGAAADEIAFGQNMTTLTFHLSRALGWRLSRGDLVLVTALDHHANVDPWRVLERERGIRVEVVAMRPDATLDWDDFQRRLAASPRIVAIGAASNAFGTINDVQRACAHARAAGAISFLDAVHYAPHVLVDVRAIGCDFLACSPYKFYGPHLGVLFARRESVEQLEMPRLQPAPDRAPERIETGTLSHEAIVGAAAAIDYLASLSGDDGARRDRLAATFGALHERADALLNRMWHGLAALPRVRLHGPQPGSPRTPTLAFSVAGRRADEVAGRLADRGVFVSHGDFYATTAVARIAPGSDGLVRAGCACYTTSEEVERLLAAVEAL